MFSTRTFIIQSVLLISAVCCGAGSDHSAAPGRLEGHLTVVSPGTVELADADSSKSISKSPLAYVLVVRSKDGKKEIARVVPDEKGDYGASLPPGEYTLDFERERERGALVRAKPRKFSVTSDRTVRVDMSIDTGVR